MSTPPGFYKEFAKSIILSTPTGFPLLVILPRGFNLLGKYIK
jgi:hypothetical protein